MIKRNNSLLLQIFGESPELKIFDYFIDNYNFPLSFSEIIKETRLRKNKVKIILYNLSRVNVIYLQNSKNNHEIFYRLNLTNPFVQTFMNLDWSLVNIMSGV